MTTPSSSSRKLVKDLKKPVSLACIFCKERKIMCGRPPADAEDQTCNQCARRKFVCEYPKEGEKPTRRRQS
ncbi:hypothetical protein CPC08DRAFT_638333 [Agrocybe pediades]|nr:hypothetical protein CPC08DRAFT_638333 [Agrocybe pediades]